MTVSVESGEEPRSTLRYQYPWTPLYLNNVSIMKSVPSKFRGQTLLGALDNTVCLLSARNFLGASQVHLAKPCHSALFGNRGALDRQLTLDLNHLFSCRSHQMLHCYFAIPRALLLMLDDAVMLRTTRRPSIQRFSRESQIEGRQRPATCDFITRAST